MLRVTFLVFLFIFAAVSGKTALTLLSNGDTATIMVQTLVCVTLMSAALYCRGLRRLGME